MTKPAARTGDMHACPMATPGTPPVPHVGGPIGPGCPVVLIGGMPAARLGDVAVCVGPPDSLAQGSPTVLIGGMPASRQGDMSMHGGAVSVGLPTVLIGDGAAGSPPAGEAPGMVAIRTLLHGSPTGQEALAIFDDNSVNVRFASGEGSYFDPATNTMTLDTGETPMESALTFVHEMGHAEYHHNGTGADINGPRDDYVNGMVAEEADGTVRSIQAQQELENAGYDAGSTSFPLQNQYENAYDQAVANEQAANPNATPEHLDAVGRQAGADRVEQGFHNGEVQTSNTGDSYPDYYGGAHDDYHAP